MRKMIFVFSVIVLVVVSATACGGSTGLPLAPSGTLLRKIQDRGTLIAATRTDLPTMGYMNPQTNAMEGFDPAIAREIAAYILGDPNKITFKKVSSTDRITVLQDGTADLTAATITITDDRLKQIDFSVMYLVAGQRILVPQGSPIKSIADLSASKKVGTAKGTTSADHLRQQTKAQVVEFDSHADALQALLKKQLDATSTDDTILYGFALTNPGLQVVGAQFSYEPLGIGVPKGQPELLNAVNTVIKNLKASGKWKAIWKAEIGDKLGVATIPDPPPDEWRR